MWCTYKHLSVSNPAFGVKNQYHLLLLHLLLHPPRTKLRSGYRSEPRVYNLRRLSSKLLSPE